MIEDDWSMDDESTDCENETGADTLEELNALLSASDVDEINEVEFDAFSAWAQSCGYPLDEVSYDDWQGSRAHEEFEFDRKVDEWVADGMPDSDATSEEIYCMPYAELVRRIEENELSEPGEMQYVWDARIAAARAKRGAPLGDYLEFDAIMAFEHLSGERAPWRDLLPHERERRMPRPPRSQTAVCEPYDPISDLLDCQGAEGASMLVR